MIIKFLRAITGGGPKRPQVEVEDAQFAFEPNVSKIRVECIIDKTIERAQSTGRYSHPIKQEPHNIQLIVAAWELMDFANPGLIEIARTGSPEQRMALFQTALCVWGHFVDMSFGEQRTDESLGEAIKVSSAIYMRVPGTEVPGKLANLPELSADKNIYADKLEAAIGKISSEVRREEAVEFAALISGRVRYVESLVQKA